MATAAEILIRIFNLLAYLVQYQEPIATLRVGEICCMSISWGSAERLAAAGTNGTVYVWDTKELLSQSKESLAEKDAG